MSQAEYGTIPNIRKLFGAIEPLDKPSLNDLTKRTKAFTTNTNNDLARQVQQRAWAKTGGGSVQPPQSSAAAAAVTSNSIWSSDELFQHRVI